MAGLLGGLFGKRKKSPKDRSGDEKGRPPSVFEPKVDIHLQRKPPSPKVSTPLFSPTQPMVETEGPEKIVLEPEDYRFETEHQKVETFEEISKGQVKIQNMVPASEIEGMELDDGLMMFSRHDLERQKRALVKVANMDGGNMILASIDDLLVSYIGIHHPSKQERWGKPGYPWLFELGAIEVTRKLRREGLARRMLRVAFQDDYYDDKVVITTGYTWHWDLEHTGLSKMEYRVIGIDLFGEFGFVEMATDEPNIIMDSANLFMARVGSRVSSSRYQKFAQLLFTNDWEAIIRGL